ncbi:uncharacterized protein LOC132725016 [Ruditapes philippinarum]|uniref:uncharacterized protein LOC132725016 n=1 Tax=Ruditapes philippinarum TaxID=129788 RepID=UPI00295B76E0|nr:uncharacterized protein LOC132725016 [Ruditapes philippinarum]
MAADPPYSNSAALRNATTQAQVEMFEQEMTRMKLAHKLEVKEAVQKAASHHVDKVEAKQRTSQGQPHDTEPVQSQGYSKYESHSSSQPRSGTVQPQGNSNMRPYQMAQKDRLQAQKSGENYKEIGSELKLLLNEMRNMITDRHDTNQWHDKRGHDKMKDRESQRGSTAPSTRHRDIRGRDIKLANKSRPKLKTADIFPVEMKKAFTHYRVPPAPSDISYYSDAEVDDRIHNRSRSQPGTYALYSPKLKENSTRSRGRHRRSRSAEASYVLPKDSSTWTDSDYRTSDYSPTAPESDITDTNTSRALTSDIETSSFTQDLLESDLITSLSVGSPVMESTKENPSPPSKSIPDTQLLCKHLEEKIISLTRMGDNLQKENKEMADLMKHREKS